MSDTTTGEKPYLECELLVKISANGSGAEILPVPEIEEGRWLELIRTSTYAEVNIPHHTEDAIYCYTCFLVGVPHNQPAIFEMGVLSRNIAAIHEQYGHLAKKPEWGGLNGAAAS
ncbi:MAG: hypothetical protein V9G98_22500 [Candidatus Competibacter sp.]